MSLSSERKFVRENVRRHLLKEYLHKETVRAGFGGLDVARTPLGTHITLTAERPGMVIGRRGATINRLTEEVQTKFGFDNPQIEVQEADVPALNPHIMVQKLAVALEKGWHFRRAGHSTVMRIMESGARGCQVEIAGKLTGDRHRTVKFRTGHIKYCGEPKQQWMRVAIGRADRKSGVMGLKVMIMDAHAKLPDEIELLPPEELTEIIAEYAPITHEGVPAVPEAEGEVDAETLDRIVEADLEAPEGPEQPAAPVEAEAPAPAEAEPAEEKKKAKPAKPRAPRKPRKKAAKPAEGAAGKGPTETSDAPKGKKAEKTAPEAPAKAEPKPAEADAPAAKEQGA